MQKFNTVAELLADPKRWTTHSMAKDKNGQSCRIYGEAACCWCLAGAIYRVYTDFVDQFPNFYRADQILVKVSKHFTDNNVGTTSFTVWNDSHTHQEVLDLAVALGI